LEQALAFVTLETDGHAEPYIFVEYFNYAHPRNKRKAKWAYPVMPTWPHLAKIASNAQRYDFVPAAAVEGVHLIVEDSNSPRHAYAVLNTDRMLWHER
jgi:hypothetical protein